MASCPKLSNASFVGANIVKLPPLRASSIPVALRAEQRMEKSSISQAISERAQPAVFDGKEVDPDVVARVGGVLGLIEARALGIVDEIDVGAAVGGRVGMAMLWGLQCFEFACREIGDRGLKATRKG
jgi:hypothetical protein